MKYAGFLKGKLQSARFIVTFTVSLILITSVLASLTVAIPFSSTVIGGVAIASPMLTSTNLPFVANSNSFCAIGNPTDTLFSGYDSPGNPALPLALFGELGLQSSSPKLTWSEATDTVNIDCRRACEDDTYTGLALSTSMVGTLSIDNSGAGSEFPNATAYDTTETTSKPLIMNTQFSDLDVSHWAQSYISTLVERGIVAGYQDGTFRPAATITREEFAKMICIAQGWTLVDPAIPSFTDIPSGTWAFKYVETARAHQAISGYSNGAFGASKQITRAEIAAIIAKSMQLSGDTSAFGDISEHWAKDAISTCVRAGIVGGYKDNTFRPDETATRAEAAKMVFGVLGMTTKESV